MATLLELYNVCKECLDYNTIHKTWPLHDGIATALKIRYRRFQMETLLDLIVENGMSI